MKLSRHQLFLAITSTLLLMAVFMALSYAQIRTANEQRIPFGLSSNYLVFRNTTREITPVEEVVHFQEDRNVLVLSHDWESSLVGIYDPMMVMAFEGGAFGYSYSRYFSEDDYEDRTQSGIVLIDPERILNADKSNYSSQNIDDILYFASDQSRFNVDGNVKEVINLAALGSLGEFVYLDFAERQDADAIIKRLLEHNYEIVDRVQYTDLLRSISNAFESPASVIMLSSLGLYLLFAVTCYWHFYNQRRELYIHYFHGGSVVKVLFGPLRFFFALNAFSLFPAAILFMLQRYSGYTVMSPVSLIFLYVFHVFTTSAIYLFAYILIFYKVVRNRNEVRYVR